MTRGYSRGIQEDEGHWCIWRHVNRKDHPNDHRLLDVDGYLR